MIVGLGIDVIEVSRLAAALDRHGDHFEVRVFTESERDACRPVIPPRSRGHDSGRSAVIRVTDARDYWNEPGASAYLRTRNESG